MEKYTNYAFISYKRKQKDGSFANDEYWADQIQKKLTSWSIPTTSPKLEKINNLKTIRPIIRDKKSFAPGKDLNETIKAALRESKTLVLILSKEMKADQEIKMQNKEDAYIYKEIEYFLSLGRAENSIIVFYINDDEYIPEECNPSVLPNMAKLPVNINEYKEEKDIVKHVCGAIATAIFDRDNKELFVCHYDDVRKHQKKVFWYSIGFITTLLIAIASLLIWREKGKTDTVEAFRAIEYSKNALEKYDREAAIIYALEAYDKSPNLPETEAYLRNFAYDDKLMPLRTYPADKWYSTSKDGSEIFILCPNNKISVLDSYTLSEKEILNIKFEPFYTKFFISDSANNLALLGADSIIIYNRKEKQTVCTTRNSVKHDGGYNPSYSWIMGEFDESENFFIFKSDKEFGVIDIIDNKKNTFLYNVKNVEYYIDKQLLYYTTPKSYPNTICYDLVKNKTEELDTIPYNFNRLLTPILSVKFERKGIISEIIRDKYYNTSNAEPSDIILSDQIIDHFEMKTKISQKDVKRYALIKNDSINIFNTHDQLIHRFTTDDQIDGSKTSFTGDTIIWWNRTYIYSVIFDRLNNPIKQKTHNYSNKKINDIVFGNNSDLVIIQEDKIIVAQLEELKNSNIYLRTLYTPNPVSSLRIVNNKIITGGKNILDGNIYIYDYPKERSEIEKTFDKAINTNKIVADRYIISVVQSNMMSDQIIQCWDFLSDSIVWEKDTKHTNINIWSYNTLSKTFLIGLNKTKKIKRGSGYAFEVDNSESNYIVVDAVTGNVKYKSDLGDRFSQFITENIIIYNNNVGKTQVIDLQSGIKVNIDTIRSCKTAFGIKNYDYSIKNNILAIACDTCIEILSISPLKRLKTINIPTIPDSVKLRQDISTNVNMSPNSRFLTVNFQSYQDARLLKEQSGCQIWDINNSSNIGVIKNTANLWQTFVSNKYIFTSDFNVICIYDIKTKELVHTYPNKPLWANCFVKMPNEHLLLHFDSGYIEIDPNSYNDIINKSYSTKNYHFANERYLESDNKLIDLAKDKILFNNGLYTISEMSKSLINITRTQIDNFEIKYETKVIPFEDIEQLRDRLKKKVSNRILTTEDIADFQN
ncbi:MAG: toll/interleukin-1 receptor domain-containing protein [Bacteroidales bacterium]